MIKPHQICTQVIMDTSDKFIYFDKNGICNHCNDFKNIISKDWFPNQEGEKKIKYIFDKIKKENKKNMTASLV